VVTLYSISSSKKTSVSECPLPYTPEKGLRVKV